MSQDTLVIIMIKDGKLYFYISTLYLDCIDRNTGLFYYVCLLCESAIWQCSDMVSSSILAISLLNVIVAVAVPVSEYSGQ